MIKKNKAMHPKIRLREYDVEAIKAAFKKNFGADDHLWIFGSRVELEKRGGDIDLYIETSESLENAYKKKRRFIGDLWATIGEQKIDVVLHLASDTEKKMIYEVAKKEGVMLV